MITEDEGLIRHEAHQHFLLDGDKVKAKAVSTAHSSYDVLRGRLTKYAYGRLDRNWQDAEDAVQAAYVKVLETAKITPFFNFGGLYKIWLDRAIRDIKIRDKKYEDVISEDREIPDTGGLTLIDLAEGDAPDTALLLEMQARINNLIDKSNTFSVSAKAIIRLTFLYGYTYKEVAGMTSTSIKRVENTLVYFKKKYQGV